MSDELTKLFVDRKVVCAMLVNTMTGKPWQEYSKRRQREDSARLARGDSVRADTARRRMETTRKKTEAELRRELGDRGLEIRRQNAQKLIRAGCIVTIATDNYLGQAPEFRRDPKPDWQDPGTGSLSAIEGLVELGMTPLQAISAATKNGAISSKALAQYGTLEPGKGADILVLGRDPIADIRNIRALEVIVRDGQVIDPAILPTRPVWTKASSVEA